MDKLDKWVVKKIYEFTNCTKREQIPLYTKLLKGDSKKKLSEGRHTLKVIYDQKLYSMAANVPDFKRLRYVRYADNFIISVIGSKLEAENLKLELSIFLQENLKLEIFPDSFKIIHASTERAFFLGTEISIKSDKSSLIRSVIKKGKNQIMKNFSRPKLTAPISKIVEKFIELGYCREDLKPIRVGRLIHYDLLQILESYKLIARAILYYYSFVSNFSRLQARIFYILKYSCALTFAAKLKLRTLKKVFKKYGPELNIEGKNGKFINFDTKNLSKVNRGFSTGNYDPISVIELAVKK